MAKGLTRRQKEILDFIIDCIREDRMPPTIAEIGEQFGITSTNGVNDHLIALEKKGYIERSSKARSIQVTDKAAAGLYDADATALPLLGRIAAGSPILAEENVEDYVPVAAAQASPGGFCLTVQGDSMIDDGILEGDTIVIDPQKRVRKGDVVVAMIDGEATVKHFFRDGDSIELRPANSAMKPMQFHAREVELQGVVVGLQRTLR